MLNFIFARDLLGAFGMGKKISAILQKDTDNKLELLLAEEETIGECKAQSAKLLEFLSEKENLIKLIHYATRIPQDPTDKDQCHKYPFVATDVLCSSSKLSEALIQIIETTQEEEITIQESNGTIHNNQEQNAQDNTNEADTEGNTIQNILKKVQDEEIIKQDNHISEKQMLVDDLEGVEIDDSEDMFENNLKQVNEQENGTTNEQPKANRNSFNNEEQYNTQDNQEQQNQEHKEDAEDEDVNVQEDEVEEHQSRNGPQQKFKIQMSKIQKKPSLISQKEEVTNEKYDYTIMNELFAFFDNEENFLPILCGYFNKIVQSLLSKIRPKMLSYLLLEREGDIYNILLNHLQHHSLSLLMIELLSLKIGQSNGFIKSKVNIKWDDNDSPQNEPQVSPQEAKMLEVLYRKRKEVIQGLLERLSAKNSDIEQCLNAHTILQELADNESMFGVLIDKDHMVSLIKNSCDIRNKNQAYALSLLTTIIREFPERDNSITQNQISEFQETIAKNFFDLTYSALMVLRASNEQLGEEQQMTENQSGVQYKKFGLKRLKALELLRQEFQTFSKYVELNSDQYISAILRRQIVGAMLDIIEEYEFSSIACHQAIIVLDFLKKSFDNEDIENLKRFVQKNLNQRTYFTFESGRQTTNTHLAAIIKMALVLKQITLQNDQNEQEEEKTKQQLSQIQDDQWSDFCEGQLQIFETKWTKRLEDYGKDEDEIEPVFQFKKTLTDDESRREDNEESETQIKNMLQNGSFKQKLIMQRNRQSQSTDTNKQPRIKVNATKNHKKNKNEDVKEVQENYQDYQYWKLPDQYNIDELLEKEGI